MKITLQNKEYTFLADYLPENKYRHAFNNLVQKVFNFSFEAWYTAGYWNGKYIPYTLFDGEKAVASASINTIDFNIFGEQQRYIQIGTVLTDPDYRNKGLSRFLMENILAEWGDKCEFIYLYANKSALEMYPRFGFTKVKEYEYFKTLKKNIKNHKAEKLTLDSQSNRDMLHGYANNSLAFGKLSMRDNANLAMFSCASYLKDAVFYIEALDVIAIAIYNNDKLHLWDIFSKNKVDLDAVIYSLIDLQIEEVVLGFTPQDSSFYQVREFLGNDALFIQKGKTRLFDENNLMFPLLSHA